MSKAEADLNASAANVTSRETDPVVADAEIKRLEAQYQQADNHLKRLEPMASGQFVTADSVDQARTQRAIAAAALEEAQAKKTRQQQGWRPLAPNMLPSKRHCIKARSDRV